MPLAVQLTQFAGGTIGTGLFIGSGTALAHGGPVGALLAYSLVGVIVFSVICSIGEMVSFIPNSGAFTAYATRFVDPSLGFAMGWMYWFSWSIAFALELTATGIIIQYWEHNVSIGIFIAVFWVFITMVNFLPVKFYGELEFWLSLSKVCTIGGFILFGICINAGASPQGYIGFRYWRDPGPFAPYMLSYLGANKETTAKFVGFWSTLVQAGFSYQGTELVGIAAGETVNPRKTVPSAIKKTFYRIILLFVLTIFFIGILIPYTNKSLISDKEDASASPLVIAAKLASVRVLPTLINAVLLLVVLSAANSNVYSGSRIILGLAQAGFAPGILQRISRHGVPVYAVFFTALFGLLAFLNLSHSGATVFNWLTNIVSLAGFISWVCMQVCHIAFMRALEAREMDRGTLPYKAPLQPYFAYFGIASNLIIIVTQGFTAFLPWNTTKFFVAYISPIIFVVFYLGHKLIYRTSFVRPGEADIYTGQVDGYDEMTESAPSSLADEQQQQQQQGPSRTRRSWTKGLEEAICARLMRKFEAMQHFRPR